MTVRDVFKIFEYFSPYIKPLTLNVEYSYNEGCSISSAQVATIESLNLFLSTHNARMLRGKEPIANITYTNSNEILFWITDNLALVLSID
jgi:hypothetical protein